MKHEILNKTTIYLLYVIDNGTWKLVYSSTIKMDCEDEQWNYWEDEEYKIVARNIKLTDKDIK